MFKLIDKDDEIPDDCYEIANVYKKGKITNKLICKYRGIGRNTEYMKPIIDNICPLCEKELSCKAAVLRHLNNNSCPIRKIEKINREKEEEATGFYNEIVLPEEKYIKNSYPNLKLRDVINIWGAQGSGKSTYCRNYVQDFIEVFPNKDVILLSTIEKDNSFKDLLEEGKIVRFPLEDESLIDDPLDTKTELINSLTIFDDYDNVKNKKIKSSLYDTIHDVITIGRDQSDSDLDTYVLVTAHNFDNRDKMTRDITKECSTLVMFPLSGQKYYIEKCLKDYCGVDKNKREYIDKLQTRWIAVHKRFPLYILHEGGVINF